MMSHRSLPRPFTMPWGKGQFTEEVRVVRERWEPTIQLLENEDGSRSLRFCFYTQGRFNRNPMMLGEEDIPELRAELAHSPKIRALLERLVR